MKVKDVEKWPKELVEALEDTFEYTFGGFLLYAKLLEQRGHNIND